MTFGERLRQLRKEKQMSMEEVGAVIGVGRANIYKYEHGIVTNIPPEKARKLAELFDVSPPYLMGWTDNRKETVSEKKGTIPILDNETFMKAYSVMPESDRAILIEIFDRAYKKLKFYEENL